MIISKIQPKKTIEFDSNRFSSEEDEVFFGKTPQKINANDSKFKEIIEGISSLEKPKENPIKEGDLISSFLLEGLLDEFIEGFL